MMRNLTPTQLHDLLSEMLPRLYSARSDDPVTENTLRFVERAVGVAQFVMVSRIDEQADQDRSKTS